VLGRFNKKFVEHYSEELTSSSPRDDTIYADGVRERQQEVSRLDNDKSNSFDSFKLMDYHVI